MPNKKASPFSIEFERIIKTRYTKTPKPVMVLRLAKFTRKHR